MKVLIFGVTGMLGHKLAQVLSSRFEVFGTARRTAEPDFPWLPATQVISSVDVTSEVDVVRALESVRPDVVINASGVIKQLPSAKDVTTALKVNALFPQFLAGLSQGRGFRLITVSTDCVFDGVSGMYTEAHTPNALDLYGQSKRWGEVSEGTSLTLRTSIIGHELGSHHSLVDWFLSNRGGRVKGFTKAIYSGFPTVVFADIIGDLIERQALLSGIYHVSSEPINKFELLQMIDRQYDSCIEITPSDELVIDRSLNSDRFRGIAGFSPLTWQEMIEAMHADFQRNAQFYK